MGEQEAATQFKARMDAEKTFYAAVYTSAKDAKTAATAFKATAGDYNAANALTFGFTSGQPNAAKALATAATARDDSFSTISDAVAKSKVLTS